MVQPGYLIMAMVMWLCMSAVAAEEYEAQLDWADAVVLSTTERGRVGEVHVQPGERVAAQALLVALDPRPFQQRLKAAEARLDRAQAELDEAQREWDRAFELYDRGSLSEHERQIADLGHTRAQSAQRIAQAELEQARLALEYSRITAPWPARVLAVHAREGSAIESGAGPLPLVSVARADQMVARLKGDPTHAARFQLGQSVAVIVADRDYAGVVTGIRAPGAIGADPSQGYSVEIRFEVSDSAGMWRGVPAKVRLP